MIHQRDLSASSTALDVVSLSKAFRGKTAVDEVSFSVPEGSLTVLLGPAGAGKTTTLRMIAGLEQPDGGRIELRSRDITALEPKDRDIAMIFDNLALYPNKSGFGNMAHPLLVSGMARDKVEERVKEIAATLRIAHVMHRLPKTMSGGERQRVALGRALVRTPRLFLLDEPLSSLDAMLRIELRAELKRLQRQLGSTFLLATPDYTEALAVADTVVMLRQGRVVQISAAQSLYDEPVNREVARFVGAPEINLIDAEFDPVDGGTLRFANAAFVAPERLKNVPDHFQAGLRPEHLALADPEAGPIRAGITDIEALGSKSVMTVSNAAGELRLVVDTGIARRHRVGETVGVRPTLERVLAFDAETGLRIDIGS